MHIIIVINFVIHLYTAFKSNDYRMPCILCYVVVIISVKLSRILTESQTFKPTTADISNYSTVIIIYKQSIYMFGLHIRPNLQFKRITTSEVIDETSFVNCCSALLIGNSQLLKWCARYTWDVTPRKLVLYILLTLQTIIE